MQELRRCEPVDAGHRQIEHDDVRFVRARLIDPRVAVSCSRDDHHVGLTVEKQTKPLAHSLVIFGEKHANHSASVSPAAIPAPGWDGAETPTSPCRGPTPV